MERFNFLFLIIVSFIFIKCNDANLIKQINFKNNLFVSDELIQFKTNKIKKNVQYDLNMLITYNYSYPYENLYLNVEIIKPDGNKINENKQIKLFNNYGIAIGKGITDLKQIEINLLKNKIFEFDGEYIINVEHIMREDTLKGICGLNLKLLNSISK